MPEPSALELLALLGTIPHLRDLPTAELSHLVPALQPRGLGRGVTLYRQDEPGTSMCLLVTGVLRVEQRDGRGAITVLASARPGEFVGEMALLDPAPRCVSVVAATDCWLYEIDRAQLTQLEAEHPAVASAVMSVIVLHVTRRLRQVHDQLQACLGGVQLPAQAATGVGARPAALRSGGHPPAPVRTSGGHAPARTSGGHVPEDASGADGGESKLGRIVSRLLGG